MKIAVTGSNGFTGRFFTAAAITAGHEITPILSDLNDSAGLKQELHAANPDALVHLAAISFVGHADEEAFYKVNVIGTMNVLSALCSLHRPVKKVLLASSANIYGNSAHSPIAEDQLPAPVNHYAMSKLAMEHMARTYADRLPLVITRPFNYTGPGQAPNFVIPKIVSQFRERRPTIELGNIHVEREFNDIRMRGAAYLALLQYGQAAETYNICTGKSYDLQSVIAQLSQMTGHTLAIHINPAFVRANEVHRLCGNPSKLHACMNNHGVDLPTPDLAETLNWMLREDAS